MVSVSFRDSPEGRALTNKQTEIKIRKIKNVFFIINSKHITKYSIDKEFELIENNRMTESQENYLEMISFLADEGEVRVTDIASRLKVSKPSVLAALKNLEEQDILEHRRYGTVSLTIKGKEEAKAIRECHLLLTTFLGDILGVDAETAEIDACKMEHLLSKETMQKMKNYIDKCRKTTAASDGNHGSR